MQIPTTINELEDNGQMYETSKSPHFNRNSLPLDNSSALQSQGSASKIRAAAQHNQAIYTQD